MNSKAKRACYMHEYKQEAVRLVRSGQSMAAVAASWGGWMERDILRLNS
jgi:transposase